MQDENQQTNEAVAEPTEAAAVVEAPTQEEQRAQRGPRGRGGRGREGGLEF